MKKFSNILVPIDFSNNSIAALDYTINTAKSNNANVHLFHCLETILKESQLDKNNNIIDPEIIKNVKKNFKKFLFGINTINLNIIEVIKAGKPYDQILNYAKDNKIDLIILSIQDYSYKSGSIIGTTAEKVTRYSEIPVILIKPTLFTVQNGYQAKDKTISSNWTR